MNTMEKTVAEVQALPEADARKVLDFVGHLKTKRAHARAAIVDTSEFDRFGAVFDGKFNRDECYDRSITGHVLNK